MHNLDKGPSCGHSWGRLFNPWNPRHLAICSLPDTEKVKMCCSQGSTNPLTHRSLQWIHLNWSQWKRMPYNSSRIREPGDVHREDVTTWANVKKPEILKNGFGNPLGHCISLFLQGHPTVCPVCGQHLLEGISLTHTKITSVPPSPGKTQGYLIWVSLQQSVLGESSWNMSHSPLEVIKHTKLPRQTVKLV